MFVMAKSLMHLMLKKKERKKEMKRAVDLQWYIGRRDAQYPSLLISGTRYDAAVLPPTHRGLSNT